MRTTTKARTAIRIPATIAVVMMLAAGAGCSTNRTLFSQVDDAGTTASVKSRLALDPDVSAYEIDVDSTGGVVRLSGWVETQAERAAAERVARATDGVKSVANEIVLGDPSLSENVGDGVILAMVKSKLAADPDVSALDIDVDVSRGVVTLSGAVAGNAQIEEAVRLAQSTDGVRSVTNNLDVTSDETR